MDYTAKWEAERERKAFLALADGTVFHGVAFGAKRDTLGEVVFNTGMSGYQEIVTDPSYAGQIVALTAAELGNYGVNHEDVESRKLFLSGLVVNDLTLPSSWRSETSLDSYLAENNIPGIRAVDVRALTLHIRDHGSQRSYLHVEDCMMDEATAIAKAREWEGLDGQDYAARVTRADVEVWDCENTEVSDPQSSTGNWQHSHIPHIVCYDFGVKQNILRSLASWAKVTVVPAKTSAEEVLAMNPDGLFLSNGPADPAAVTYAIENIRKLLGIAPLSSSSLVARHLSLVTPVMGICLGHQLLSLACGAKTIRLKFGHHGCNHPVKNLATGKVEITSQNHNFAVDDTTLPDCLEVTHLNLNDATIEGVRHKTLPAFSVQYHPEACPGPHDSGCLFGEFKRMVESNRNQSAAIG
ncbi:MAG: glutamine-hydrolyzing carbamoyl-phosphate synthase small subunit [Kiritimatiellae bacterium]|nr:glutamine-hydrolyzing carbamoyl-phosphate synthase small subunit [Kiritimatiellia bacterium]